MWQYCHPSYLFVIFLACLCQPFILNLCHCFRFGLKSIYWLFFWVFSYDHIYHHIWCHPIYCILCFLILFLWLFITVFTIWSIAYIFGTISLVYFQGISPYFSMAITTTYVYVLLVASHKLAKADWLTADWLWHRLSFCDFCTFV